METDPTLYRLRHDMRTRMTCIYNAVEILERMDLNNEQRWCIDTMKLEAEALLALVNEISNLCTTHSEDTSETER